MFFYRVIPESENFNIDSKILIFITGDGFFISDIANSFIIASYEAKNLLLSKVLIPKCLAFRMTFLF